MVDALDLWKRMNDAERAIEDGGDTSGMDPDVLAKARRNVAWRTRYNEEKARVEATWSERMEAVRSRFIKAWSGFDPDDPCQGVIREGHVDACDSVKAVRKFLADDSLRFLLLLGGVGCGKTFAAMVGAWDTQAASSTAASEREMRPTHSDAFSGIGSEGADAWFESRVSSVLACRRPALQWSIWHARDLPMIWDPWKAEIEAGHRPGMRDRPYLTLDDLGTERESDRFHEAFGAFVDHRMLGGFKTVITTNLAKPDIRARYGDRIADRINHVGKSFVVGGASRRKNGAGL